MFNAIHTSGSLRLPQYPPPGGIETRRWGKVQIRTQVLILRTCMRCSLCIDLFLQDSSEYFFTSFVLILTNFCY